MRWPKTIGLRREMPSGPLVRKSISLIRIWTIVPKASVTMARYGPVTRSAGSASTAPKRAVTATAAGSVTHIGSASLKTSTPTVYEPTPKSEACPSDISPV